MTMRTAVLAGTLALGGLLACDKTPTKPTPVCTFTIAPPAQSFADSGGSGSIAITASDPSCAWSATSGASWVTLGAASGTGSGTLGYQVASNGSMDGRSTTVTVGGQSHAVSQSGRPSTPCTFEIAPAAATFGDSGGTGSFAVMAPDGCAWSATSSAPWVVVTGGASGSGNGTVSFALTENNGDTTREATIALANRLFAVTQLAEPAAPEACVYSVSPVLLEPCMWGTTASTTVTAPNSCTWTASSSVPWLTITNGTSGSGTGQVTFTFTNNYDAPRTGLVMVRWPTPTAGQNVRVEQAGCFYFPTQSSFHPTAAGGSFSFYVFQQASPIECGGPRQNQCVWSAVSNVPWITITNPLTYQVGDGHVSFDVSINGTGSTRTGTITVMGETVVVVQGG